MDETVFKRKHALQSESHGQVLNRSRWLRLPGVEQFSDRYHENFVQAAMRPFVAFSKIPVIVLTVYYFLVFAWIISQYLRNSLRDI